MTNILKELPDFDYGYVMIPASGQLFGLRPSDYVDSLVEQLNDRAAKNKRRYKYAVLFQTHRNAYIFKWAPEEMTPAQYDKAMGFSKA